MSTWNRVTLTCNLCGREYDDFPGGRYCSIVCVRRAQEARVGPFAETTYHMAQLPGGVLPLPVEPLYDLPLAAALIPWTLGTLRTYLNTHRDQFPPRYRWDARHRSHRMLSASEIKTLRARAIRTSRSRRATPHEGEPSIHV